MARLPMLTLACLSVLLLIAHAGDSKPDFDTAFKQWLASNPSENDFYKTCVNLYDFLDNKAPHYSSCTSQVSEKKQELIEKYTELYNKDEWTIDEIGHDFVDLTFPGLSTDATNCVRSSQFANDDFMKPFMTVLGDNPELAKTYLNNGLEFEKYTEMLRGTDCEKVAVAAANKLEILATDLSRQLYEKESTIAETSWRFVGTIIPDCTRAFKKCIDKEEF